MYHHDMITRMKEAKAEGVAESAEIIKAKDAELMVNATRLSEKDAELAMKDAELLAKDAAHAAEIEQLKALLRGKG
jgi:hypothetical protein